MSTYDSATMVAFFEFQTNCRYNELRSGEDTCNKKNNIPLGYSWGECCIDNCPYMIVEIG
jgi:hypothetical protein